MNEHPLRFGSLGDSLLSVSLEYHNEFASIIRKPLFTVSDSSLSYRQINYLGDTAVLPEKRKNNKEWRKFSLKEVIFLSLVKELKQYGFKESLLIALRKVFFEVRKGFDTDLAILAVLNGFGVYMTVDTEGGICFYDMATFGFLRDRKQPSLLLLNLNGMILPLWEKLGKRKIEYKDETTLLFEVVNDLILSEQETELLKIIRNQEYSVITVKKQNDSTLVVKADSKKKVKEKELLELIRTKQFADIEVIKRDGEIVNVRVAETHKIRG